MVYLCYIFAFLLASVAKIAFSDEDTRCGYEVNYPVTIHWQPVYRDTGGIVPFPIFYFH